VAQEGRGGEGAEGAEGAEDEPTLRVPPTGRVTRDASFHTCNRRRGGSPGRGREPTQAHASRGSQDSTLPKDCSCEEEEEEGRGKGGEGEPTSHTPRTTPRTRAPPRTPTPRTSLMPLIPLTTPRTRTGKGTEGKGRRTAASHDSHRSQDSHASHASKR
jgi:hypothetical protein